MSKKPPKIERIARTVGTTTFRDLKEGFGGGLSTHDSDADIKAALGMAQSRVGELAVMVLESRYASTLRYEWVIRRAYERECARVGPHARAKRRIATALAIRQFVGAKLAPRDIEGWAWLMCGHRNDLKRDMAACTLWLNAKCDDAKDVFLDAMGVLRAKRRPRAA
jgi:hypothetical protein